MIIGVKKMWVLEDNEGKCKMYVYDSRMNVMKNCS